MKDYLERITPRIREVYHIDNNTSYSIEEVDARTLISPYRLDIIMKLYYVNCKENGLDMTYATDLFKKQVYSVTAFTNKENGQGYKNSQDAFETEFCNILSSIKKDGFDNNRSLIPVSNDNVVLDGAHRLACAIYYGIKVTVIRFPHISIKSGVSPCRYDYNYFREFLLDNKYIELSVREYIKWSTKNLYVACLWPVAADEEKRKKAISIIRDRYKVVSIKDCKMSFRAFCKFIAQVYMHDTWVGSIENDFAGSSSKALLTYKSPGSMSFIFFEGESKEETLALKDEIRAIFNIDKHSIHITDNTQETKLISDIVLNDNSLIFLEKSNTKRNVKLIRKLFTNDEASIFGIEHSKGVYGLKDANQDMIDDSLQNIKEEYKISDLLAIPETYYTYLGKKFIVPQKIILNKYFSSYDDTGLLSANSAHMKYLQDRISYYGSYTKMRIKKIVKKILKRS